ncbi:hypothetical protein BGZ63DRAFT_384858 [Mariannaea sp. PMI_226]|nr:hypothetical protein BGZ63DRAFT_384858 [Mariannaea sp. PMI_226]
MASELEGLIATLLVLISCGGEQGCSVSDVVDAIHNPLRTQHSSLERDVQSHDSGSGFRHRTASTIWKWLAARRDVSVGPGRKFNHLSLDEVLALSQPPSQQQSLASFNEKNGKLAALEPSFDTPASSHHVRVSVSEETMWESLTGHAVDYKRVPRSEWLLLLGIASTTSKGILQGDLGRLVDQDKRSVPKRTDALLKKGYIAKRTTLVRGTKTSKMWLKMFSPSLAKDGDSADEPRAELNLTRQVLVDTLDPVPWHVRWTGESVDYTALAITILAIAKEWGVLRLQDLKSKLGVLGMRWQMKVLAKVCRFLNSRGVIQYVAAKLGDKVFKDCIKYGRDLNSDDWSIFLATGKRATKPSRNPDAASGDTTDGKFVDGLPANASEVSSSPPWELDKPLPITIAEMAQRLGDRGMSNPDVYGLTLGTSFSRYLSSMTSALATPGLQPPNLQHFQLRSEHTRTGKIASYRYFSQHTAPLASNPAESAPASEIAQKGSGVERSSSILSSTADLTYGFAPVPTGAMTSTAVATLTELCTREPANKKPKGRPKKQQKALTADDRSNEKVDSSQGLTLEPPTDEPPQQDPETRPDDTSLLNTTPHEAKGVTKLPNEAKKLVVTLKLSPEALKNLVQPKDKSSLQSSPAKGKVLSEESVAMSPLRPRRARVGAEHPIIETPSRPKRKRPAGADTEVDGENTVEVFTPVMGDEAGVANGEQGTTGPKKRGRPKRGGKGAQPTPTSSSSAAKPWRCEKCGGSWKNDLGLKYHLEKSKTTCNPSYDANAEPTPRGRGRKQALLEPDDDEATPTLAVSETPRNGKSVGSGGDLAEDNPAFTSASDSEHTPIVTKVRRRAVPPLRVDPRPSVSLTGGHLQAIPEWRRPLVIGFDSPGKSPLSNTAGGALVQGQAGPLRPALGPSDRPKSASATPKPASTPNKDQAKENTSPLEGTGDEVGNESAFTNGASENKLASSKIVDSLLPKVTISSRLTKIITSLLEEQEGVFPGGRGLWHAITMRWSEKFPNELAPTTRAYQAALRELVKTKTAAEHFHAFRDSKGIFCKCHIVVLGDKDPFSKEAMNLVDRTKEVYPATYVPPPFDTLPALGSAKDLRRGRRQLAEEVETLDAPVYIAQAAAKRVLDGQDGIDSTPRAKRRKVRMATATSSPVSPGKKYVSWLDADQSDCGVSQPVWPRPSEYFSSQKGLEDIEFLDPNTFLLEEAPARHEKRLQSSTYAESEECMIDPQLMSEDTTIRTTFEDPVSLIGQNGTWRYMGLLDFEMQGGSFALEGWMPDANWFSWAEMIEEIERRTNAIGRIRRKARTNTEPYDRFKDRLMACMEVEKAWTESFIGSPPSSTCLHNIFVRFFVGRHAPVSTPLGPIEWPAEGQITPTSFDLSAQAQEREPGEEEDESSDDEDPFEWPTLRLRLAESLKSSHRTAEPTASRQEHISRGQIKRVQLVSRALTSLPSRLHGLQVDKDTSTVEDIHEDADQLLAAFIAVRVLLGGADKSVDWGLLLKLFPKITIIQLRRFWLSARKEQGAYVAKLTKDFQDKFLVAYERGELPEIDFDEPLEYDWRGIIEWTLRLRRREGIRLPRTREELKEQFTSHEVPVTDDDWREKFFHPQSSVFSRFESSTAAPAAVPVHQRNMMREYESRPEVTDLDVARSWVRSLCCTDESRYLPYQIKNKFSTLANGDTEENNKLLKQAIADLTHQRVICKSKKPPLGGRPYRLNESYSYTLGKMAQQQKYQEAFALKAKLDAVFRRNETMKVPFTLDDGSVMALTNLNAAGRIKLAPVDVPDIPLGFEPGNYESRKYPKHYYHFGIEVVPTETYQYNDDIKVLSMAAEAGPPAEGSRGELPQWIDFFGQQDPKRWTDILGAFCFIFATRGLLTVEGICSALRPLLEEFEAHMIIDWGKKTGVLKDAEDGMGVMVGEWWWLAVPWQLQQQQVSKP